MVHADTTRRSALDADHLIARLQARGVEQLRDEAALWVLVDGSDLRKPHAQAMEGLQRVKRLAGEGLIPGYRTLNAIGVGRQRRGLLYHRLFSSAAPGFLSESAEAQAALASIGAALAPLGAEVTYVFDAGFDDVAVWATVWGQGHHLVCRLKHRDRLVRPAADQPACHLHELAPRLRPLARVETEMVVRKGRQARPKLQPVTAVVAAVPLAVDYQEEARTRADGARRARRAWLVEVRLEGAHEEPWWLLTDRAVTTPEQATEIFRMYRQRWAIEDAFKVGKQCLGWEDVQVLKLDAVRTLVALGWVAAGFLYELGVTLEWPEVRLLTRLGGGEARANRPAGKLVLTRGLRRLLDHLATEAILAAEIQRHGSLPPRIAALLGRAGPD
ncbi:MAG TPA: transposase [Thermomicrobiales bacterium]|nr:transposase [Thermomicrobiales bacterium]